jgi:hypothetical protein
MTPLVPGERSGVVSLVLELEFAWLPWTGVGLPLYRKWCMAPLVPELVCGSPVPGLAECGSLSVRSCVWLSWCQEWCVAPLVPGVVCGLPWLQEWCVVSPGDRSGVWLPW